MTARTRISLPAVGLQVVAFAFTVLMLWVEGFSGFADDPGVGWHLETGDLVLESSAVPLADPFLAQPDGCLPGASCARRPWVSDQWLSDVALALLDRVGGWGLQYGTFTALYLGVFFIALYRYAARESGSPLCATIAVLLAGKLAQLHLIVRPVGFSFGLFFCLLAILAAVRRAERSSVGIVLGIAALFAVWANVHGSFVLGLAVIGLFCFEAVVLRESGEPYRARFVPGIVLLGVGVVASLLNPQGFALHDSIVRLGQSEYFMNLHQEWRSPDFKRAEGQLVEVMAAILFLGALLSDKRPFVRRVLELLPAALFLHLGLGSIRVLPYFGLLAVVPLARALNVLREEAERHAGERLRAAFRWLDERERVTSSNQVVAMCLLLVCVFGAIVAGPARFGFGPSPREYPYGAVDELRKSAGAGKLVVASVPDWGGFLTRYGEGALIPIIDDRNTMLGEEFYREYFERMAWHADWRGYLAKFGASRLLLPPGSQLARSLSKTGELRVEYRDGVSVVFSLVTAE